MRMNLLAGFVEAAFRLFLWFAETSFNEQMRGDVAPAYVCLWHLADADVGLCLCPLPGVEPTSLIQT
jgi:hypothetical protein